MWILRNVILNIVVLSIVVITEIFNIELLYSLIIGYYAADVINAIIFKVPKFKNTDMTPILRPITPTHLIYSIVPGIVLGYITYSIIIQLVKHIPYEGLVITLPILIVNLVVSTLDHLVARSAKVKKLEQ